MTNRHKIAFFAGIFWLLLCLLFGVPAIVLGQDTTHVGLNRDHVRLVSVANQIIIGVSNYQKYDGTFTKGATCKIYQNSERAFQLLRCKGQF